MYSTVHTSIYNVISNSKSLNKDILQFKVLNYRKI